jgi:hypothetical protein
LGKAEAAPGNPPARMMDAAASMIGRVQWMRSFWADL